MRAASAAFGRVVAGSHRVNVQVDLLFNRAVIAADLPIISGTVTWDRNAEQLASLECVVAGSLSAASLASLTPYGSELQVWRGVELTGDSNADIVYDASGAPVLDAIADGDDIVSDTKIDAVATGLLELVSLGVFPIQQVDTDGVTQETIVIADDRSRLVADARFEDDYTVAAGTNYATAIEELIADGVGGLTYLFPTTSYTTPLLVFAAQEDRWAAAVKMAQSIGMNLFFDGLGRCVMRPEPTFADVPVATISEGVNMIAAGKSLDREHAYNKVIAVSRNASTGEVFRGVATDDDPESPTYYNDLGFGEKPRFFYSEFLNSDDQAESAAAAILAANIGVAKAVEFTMLPDPRLETSDAVVITNTVLGVDELHLIDELSIGLTAADPMVGASRTNQEPSL